MSNSARGGSSPDHRDGQFKVQLSRYDAERWTLSDGRGVIVAAAEDLVRVKQ